MRENILSYSAGHTESISLPNMLFDASAIGFPTNTIKYQSEENVIDACAHPQISSFNFKWCVLEVLAFVDDRCLNLQDVPVNKGER